MRGKNNLSFFVIVTSLFVNIDIKYYLEVVLIVDSSFDPPGSNGKTKLILVHYIPFICSLKITCTKQLCQVFKFVVFVIDFYSSRLDILLKFNHIYIYREKIVLCIEGIEETF